MKPSVSPTATSRVLLDIDRAMAPVERARTAAAVERVLRTATPDVIGDASPEGGELTLSLCGELGLEPFCSWHSSQCDCSGSEIDRDTLGGLLRVGRRHPWQLPADEVSPHLFEQGKAS